EDYFINRLGFIIRHELAHIYLGKFKNEMQCDCYALATYSLSGLWSKNVLGAFQEMLEASINNNMAELWGMDDLTLFNKRIAFVDSISKKPVSINFCETINE